MHCLPIRKLCIAYRIPRLHRLSSWKIPIIHRSHLQFILHKLYSRCVWNRRIEHMHTVFSRNIYAHNGRVKLYFLQRRDIWIAEWRFIQCSVYTMQSWNLWSFGWSFSYYCMFKLFTRFLFINKWSQSVHPMHGRHVYHRLKWHVLRCLSGRNLWAVSWGLFKRCLHKLHSRYIWNRRYEHLHDMSHWHLRNSNGL